MLKAVSVIVVLVLVSTGIALGDAAAGGASDSVFTLTSMPRLFMAGAEADAEADATTADDAPAGPPAKGPPLPIHSIEGVGGMAITPMAYLTNPGPKGTNIGLPSFSFTAVWAGSKTVQSWAISQTFFGRVELGYALNRHGLGGLPDAIEKATGVDIKRHDVYMHNFNVRVLALEENSFDLPLPAVTFGVHFKYNHGIRKIDDRLGGALTGLGFAKSNGVEFTMTASKTFPNVICGRPIIGTIGMRHSNASHIGYLGFGNNYHLSVEGSVVCLVTDWLAMGYEFRQKVTQYHRLDHIEGKEGDWHMFSLGWIINNHMTLAAGIGSLGTIHNSHGSPAFAFQFKWEL